MKVYKTNEIKNVSLLGGKGSGKTTLAEAILHGSVSVPLPDHGSPSAKAPVQTIQAASTNSRIKSRSLVFLLFMISFPPDD